MIGWLFNFCITVAAVPVCAQYLDGVTMITLQGALIMGAVLGAVYTVLRPFVRLILSVFNFFTLGLLYVAVDTWLVWTAARLIPNSISFASVWWAAAVSVLINAARALIRGVSR